MAPDMRNATGEGGAVVHWLADRTEYSALAAVEQRQFHRLLRALERHGDDPSPDARAEIFTARRAWFSVYDAVLASDFGGATA